MTPVGIEYSDPTLPTTMTTPAETTPLAQDAGAPTDALSDLGARGLLSLMRYGDVYRFHTRPVLKRDTVNEHSGRVALLMVTLWPECTLRAVKGALMHDLAEHYLGDVPHPVKKLPGLAAAYSAMEADVEYRLKLTPLAPGDQYTPEEFWWLKYCDWLEGALYCVRERTMGNHLLQNPFQKWMELLFQWAGEQYLAQCPDDPRGTEKVHEMLRMLTSLQYLYDAPEVVADLYQ